MEYVLCYLESTRKTFQTDTYENGLAKHNKKQMKPKKTFLKF